MTAFVLACLLRLAPFMVAREADLADLTAAIANVASSREEAALLVSVAYWETARTLEARPGDNGHSQSVFQVWVCPGEHCARVKRSVAYAAEVAAWRIRASIARCGKVPGADVLAEYTTGACRANSEARVRWRTAKWLLGAVDVAA